MQPGDRDAAETTQSPEQTQQYVTLYESLRGFDERAALDRLAMPRLVFAGADDNIRYGPRWDNAYVAIAGAVREHHDELGKLGWTVELPADAEHMSAMQAGRVLAVLVPWLREHWC
ncbi:hypothetical protein [Actinoplanes auranticolor]|uniref:hypothetical protein n=1 Tax=Actinoplanes auranticolor TaxID=47988 RepID=UPI001BB3EFEF|nr:hypothetical protein [Actinoplanes auranticolor]